MKLSRLSILLSALVLVGCINNDVTHTHEVSKEEFEKEIHPDNVLLHSNYVYKVYQNDSLYLTGEFDNGKVKSVFNNPRSVTRFLISKKTLISNFLMSSNMKKMT